MDRLRDALRRPRVWLIPLVIAAIQLVGSSRPQHHRGGPDLRNGPDLHWVPLNWFGYLLLIAGPVALLWRTIYPYTVLLIVIAITMGYLAAGFRAGPVFVSLIVAFLTAAVTGPRWRTYPLPLLGWAAAVWLIPLLRGEDPPPTIAIGAIAAWLIVLVAVAEGIRQRRAVVDARRQRKAAMAREARAEQERRATDARLSIARELHDVLAHSLSMINVQSSVALELLEDQPERAGPALAAIKEASKQAISDVHSLVTALRADNGCRRHHPGIAVWTPGRFGARDGVDGDDGRARRATRAAFDDRCRRGTHRSGVADECGAALDGSKCHGDSRLRARGGDGRRRQRWPSLNASPPRAAAASSGCVSAPARLAETYPCTGIRVAGSV